MRVIIEERFPDVPGKRAASMLLCLPLVFASVIRQIRSGTSVPFQFPRLNESLHTGNPPERLVQQDSLGIDHPC
jgi:hypothetical protein